jgi:perosamine synthetase
MLLTNDPDIYKISKSNRSHGIDRSHSERESYYYEMNSLGYNYRISDILCALGIHQCKKIETFVSIRIIVADLYTEYFKDITGLQLLNNINHHSYHLYIIKILNGKRDYVYNELKKIGINCNVHYLPIYLHPYYKTLGFNKGLCPISEKVYDQILSIPIYPTLRSNEVKFIIENIIKLVS